MMSLVATVTKASSVVAAITVIVGGGFAMDDRHAKQSEFDTHVSSNRVRTILDLVEQSRSDGAPGYLCRAIDSEFIALCTENPKHYLCQDPDAKRELLKKAGCN